MSLRSLINLVGPKAVRKHPGPDGSDVHGTGTDQSVHGGVGFARVDELKAELEGASLERAKEIRQWADDKIDELRDTRHESRSGSTLQRLNNLYYAADNKIEEASYRISHQPSADYGAPAHDLTHIVAEDIYTHPEWYMSPQQKGYRASVDMIRRVRGKPDATVKIYRAVPLDETITTINPGDWVTPSRGYARQHGQGFPGERTNARGEPLNYKILTKEVPAKELVWPGDYLPEWGWFPENEFAKHGDGSHNEEDHGNWADNRIGRVSTRILNDIALWNLDELDEDDKRAVTDLAFGEEDILPRNSIDRVGIQDPVDLKWGKDRPYVEDGNHRVAAATLLGIRSIPVEVSRNQGPAKRAKVADWLKEHDLDEVFKHAGPGLHPGTGTPQSVHGGGSGRSALSPDLHNAIESWIGWPPHERPINPPHPSQGEIKRHWRDLRSGDPFQGEDGDVRSLVAELRERIRDHGPVDYPLYRGLALNGSMYNSVLTDGFIQDFGSYTSKRDLAQWFASQRSDVGKAQMIVLEIPPNSVPALPISRFAGTEEPFFVNADEHLAEGTFRIVDVRRESSPRQFHDLEAGRVYDSPWDDDEVTVTFLRLEPVVVKRDEPPYIDDEPWFHWPEGIAKHYGPGPHPGTGTPQTIHAPGGGLSESKVADYLHERHADFFAAFPNPPQQFVDPEDGTIDHDAYRFINEVHDQFEGNEDLEAQWSDSIDKLYDDLRAIKNDNERDLLIRLAKNEISPEEAIERGISKYSQEIRDLGELPDTVYHVTTDTSAVLETGLKARDELAQDKGLGLGGGTANTISFTADEEIAHGILRGMRERHTVLNDPQTHIPRLIEEARAGTGADRPWWGAMETKWGGDKADALSNGGVDALLNRESIYVSSRGHKTAEEVRAYFDDSRVSYWRDKYDLDSIELLKPAEGIGERAVFKVGYTEAGYAEAVGDFMDEYAVYRQSAGGPLDPLFISNDDLAFKNKDADDFSIIKGDTIEGAKGYQLSALGEWRTWTGEVLESMEAIK